MQASQIPAKFQKAFASQAGTGFIRPIPVGSQIGITAGAASQADGFPPLCFLPVGSGGTPPSGQDFNGLFNQISSWSLWQAAGGPVYYDSVFATAIGGYPKGAVIDAATFGSCWLCTVDNNTTNPDAGGAGWVSFAQAPSLYVGSAAGGSSTALTTTLSPLPPHGATNYLISMPLPSGTTNGASATLAWVDAGGSAVTANLVINSSGAAVSGGELSPSSDALIYYDGSGNARVMVPAPAAPPVNSSTGFGTGVGNFIIQYVSCGNYAPQYYGLAQGTTTSASNLSNGTVPTSPGLPAQVAINGSSVPPGYGNGQSSGPWIYYPGLTGTWRLYGWTTLPGYQSPYGYAFHLYWVRIL